MVVVIMLVAYDPWAVMEPWWNPTTELQVNAALSIMLLTPPKR
jgi:hypothetical protein